MIVSGLGVLLALAVMAVSAIVNARYGMSLARKGFDQHVMMGVAVFADAGKAISWIFFAAALARRQWLASLAALLIFLTCLAYAVAGSLGYVAMHRAETTATVVATGTSAKDLDADIDRKQGQLAKLGILEPASVIAKRIDAAKQDRRYTLTRQCADITTDSSRSFCTTLSGLETAEEQASAAASLEAELAILRSQRRAMGGVATADTGDFQGSLIAQLSGFKVATIQLSLSLLFVIMVESGACFLLWLSLNHGENALSGSRARRAATHPDTGDTPGPTYVPTGTTPVPPLSPALSPTPPTVATPPSQPAPASPSLAGTNSPTQPPPPTSPAINGPTETPTRTTQTPTPRAPRRFSQPTTATTPPATRSPTDTPMGATGLATATTTAPTSSATPPTLPATPLAIGDLVAFVEDCVDLSEHDSTEVGEIASAYKRWCMQQGTRPLSDALIAEGLQRFCAAGRIGQAQKGGRVHFLGVVLTKAARATEARRQSRRS